MLLAHLVVAGPVEAGLTAAVLAYLVRANPAALTTTHRGLTAAPGTPGTPGTSGTPGVRTGTARLTPATVAVGFVVALTALTPLGLLAPGGAFGEDAPEDLPLDQLGLQAVPEGMQRYTGFWSHTLLGDYGFGSGDNATLAYWLSALVGLAVIGLVVYAVGRSLAWAAEGRRGAVAPRGRS
jgi:cobalt/nickel transport system permease protein